jgi:hypothetical protein
MGSFSGEHLRYGWGSKTVGRVTGTYRKPWRTSGLPVIA